MKARLLNKVVLDLCAVTAHLAELVTQILKANAVAWIYVHPGHLPSVTHPHPPHLHTLSPAFVKG